MQQIVFEMALHQIRDFVEAPLWTSQYSTIFKDFKARVCFLQVVLAVMMAVSAHQASGSPTYGYGQGQGYGLGYGQPRYVGPLASKVPAGVGGKLIPVSDTYEVAAAKDQFFRSYKEQLDKIYAIRASRPLRYGTPGYGYGPAGPAVHVSQPIHKPAVHVANSFHKAPVHVTTSVHRPAVHVSHSTHSAPVHVSQPIHAPAVPLTHGAQPGGYSGVPVPVKDTPEVAGVKAQFFAEYNKQAALAAAAPDNTYYH